MRRREFIALLGGAVATWPLAGRAQQGGLVRRLGVLVAAYTQNDREGQARIGAFIDTLQRLGWADGRNLRIDYRWAAGDADRGKNFAAELVRSSPDVIVANGNPVLVELHRLTSTVPIVFTQVSDPVGSGVVAGFARPGGNLTGFTSFEFSIGTKWLEALKQVAPHVTRVLLMFNPQSAPFADLFLRPVEAAAPHLSVVPIRAAVRATADVDHVFDAFAREPNTGLMVLPDISMTNYREVIVTLAARHRVPAIYPFRYFAVSGGLMSYGTDLAEVSWRAATYVDRILKGEKPAGLPVQAPTKYETVINLKTAKALGLTIPPNLLFTADEVIE